MAEYFCIRVHANIVSGTKQAGLVVWFSWLQAQQNQKRIKPLAVSHLAIWLTLAMIKGLVPGAIDRDEQPYLSVKHIVYFQRHHYFDQNALTQGVSCYVL